VAFALEVGVIAVVLSGIGLVRDVPYTGPRRDRPVGAVLSVWAWAASCSGILCGRKAAKRLLR
jgi:hypothetical protein